MVGAISVATLETIAMIGTVTMAEATDEIGTEIEAKTATSDRAWW
jgi:hypothetical protein